ncbi:tetratricopeptide repeat protein [Streptomyces chartreusis]|uniref:tetratricopeptide repeat protein n=1 Tax=Streptomyces chartreusis TaxID=1969 RepID=UPI0038196860
MTEAEGQDPSAVQNVTAVNGFAYGTIGADIHVFDNGLPLYLLANWQHETAARPDWLRELPSRMLNAHRAVVYFTGRSDDLALLRRWRDSGPRLAVRWLHGPGGQGKTRLAAQFATESAAAGWKVIAAFHGPDADPIEPGSHDLRLNGFAGLLIIIDYADRWRLTHLTWLFKNNLLHHTGVPTRVLMVARTADAWPRIRGILDTYQAGTSSHPLLALAQESGERTTMFSAARDGFAALYRLTDTAAIESPGLLDDPEFGLTLAIHMAALVAVDACATGQRSPPNMAGLTIYLLDREQLHWARLYSDDTNRFEAVGHAYRTRPEVMNQTVFTAALTGTVAHAVGKALLENLQIPQPQQILKDHAVCYPPADPSQATVLEPLYPDRLAEDFLALTMPGHEADYPPQPWAVPTATALLARHSDEHLPAAWTPRAVTFLASAAHRWPHLAPRYLYPLLLDDPQLAMDAGNAALTSIADLPDIDPPVLIAIEGCLGEQRYVDLDTGIAALTQRLADHRLSKTVDPEEQARIHHDLGVRLSYAGLNDQALAAAQEAVRIQRPLAKTNPAAYEPNFASTLSGLGASLGKLGRWEEALAADQEAVEVWRHLAKANPAAHEPDLATTLNNLSVDLSELGRRKESLVASREAVRLYRRLAKADPAAHEPGLAISLSTLGRMWSEARRPKKALAATRKAMGINRRLAKANPAAHEPALAVSLSNLGGGLSGLGRPKEAVAANQEAVEVWRRLARANPAAHEPELATSLYNLSILLWKVGFREEALAADQEAVEVWRRLAKANPAAHEPDLADSLFNLGARLGYMSRLEEALAPTRESVRLYRQLAKANPATHEPDLAASLDNLSMDLRGLGARKEALDVDDEAVEVWRRLAKANPAAHEPDLAESLLNLGAHLSQLERWQEALAAAQEAVTVYRRLAKTDSAAHEPDLAISLFNLGRICSGLKRPGEAAAACHEAVTVYRRLATADPATHEPGLASSLLNLSIDLQELGFRDEALAAAREAVHIRRRRAKANPAAHEPDLASSLLHLGRICSELGLHEEALAATGKAVHSWRRLAKADRAAHEPDLARSMWVYSSVRIMCQLELSRAFASIKAACAIHRRWHESLPTAFSGDRGGALGTAVGVLNALGRSSEAAALRRLIETQKLDAAADLLQGIDHP